MRLSDLSPLMRSISYPAVISMPLKAQIIKDLHVPQIYVDEIRKSISESDIQRPEVTSIFRSIDQTNENLRSVIDSVNIPVVTR
jgi:hypothetical protein